ncbi:MAG: hypothetical protein SF123_21500 [Chloroflexota bacterium]|nr:hypothetical protein [Chloroflexota bacterium]
MQIDIVTLCLFAILVIVAFMFMSRMMGQGRGYPGGRSGGMGVPPRGPNRPQVDDPDIQSRGGFGDQPSSRGSGMSSGSRSESGGSASATGTPGRQGGPLFPTQNAPSRRDNDDDDSSPARRAGGLFGDRDRDNDRGDDRPARSRDDGPADDPDIESRGGFGRPK